MEYYLAVDIGASGGRHMLAHLQDGKIMLEEVYRFENGIRDENGVKVWDCDRLFSEILTGMRKCAEIGKIPVSMGIDTWAVDFVLLDENDAKIGRTVAYRDSRTDGMDEEVYRLIPQEELYVRTGIQKQSFNTIYQLMALKRKEPGQLEKAGTLLLIPDYFHFLLTGKKCAEYTNATTTQLVSPHTKDWDEELISRLGYPRGIFPEIVHPLTRLGRLTKEIQRQAGFDCEVVIPATHDTASAVAAVPALSDALYISSGTWSLMGTELLEANCSGESEAHNMTNEGGYEGRFRFLKNIMGMWMINSIKKELAPDLSYGQLCRDASACEIPSLVDAGSARFFAPRSMSGEVRAACAESGQQIPGTPAEYAAVVYRSLAKCYADTAAEIECLTKQTYDSVYIVGGGANADYLNELTACACHKTVFAGPIEATAIGNAAVQMIAAGKLRNLEDARACIRRSFEIKKYEPNRRNFS